MNAHAPHDAPATPAGQAPLWPLLLGVVAVRLKDEDLIHADPVDLWACQEAAGGEGPKWVRIAFEGTWKGHPRGPFTLNRTVFEQMETNFRAAGREHVVDYEHASSVPGLEAPAAGWVKDLRLAATEDGKDAIEALIAWNDRAARSIANKEYRYLSPGFSLRARDKKTNKDIGARLGHVALTNTPFLDELPPLSLCEGGESKESKDMEEILKKLGLADRVTPQQVMEKLDELLQLAEQGKQASADLKEISGALELSESAGAKDAVRAITQLRNPADRASAQELRELREKMARRDAAEAVERALCEGKVTAVGTEQHKWASDYALKDPEGFTAWAKSAPTVVPVRPVERGSQTATMTLSEAQQKACREMGITEEQFRKYNAPDFEG